MGMLQLDPPIPLSTPRGKGLAHVLLDYGPEYDLCWVVFLDETGESWTFRNPEVRALTNETFGRFPVERVPS